MKQFKPLIELINNLKTDNERLDFAAKYNELICIELDNDNTLLMFNIDVDSPDYDDDIMGEYLDMIDSNCTRFDKYLGNAQGVYTLLEHIGAVARPC